MGGKHYCDAKLIDIHPARYRDVPQVFLCCDTGASDEIENNEIFFKFGISHPDTKVIILGLKKIKKDNNNDTENVQITKQW